jgi:hypothetical protein
VFVVLNLLLCSSHVDSLNPFTLKPLSLLLTIVLYDFVYCCHYYYCIAILLRLLFFMSFIFIIYLLLLVMHYYYICSLILLLILSAAIFYRIVLIIYISNDNKMPQIDASVLYLSSNFNFQDQSLIVKHLIIIII